MAKLHSTHLQFPKDVFIKFQLLCKAQGKSVKQVLLELMKTYIDQRTHGNQELGDALETLADVSGSGN